MEVTIITAVYNSASFIEGTINSIRRQKNNNTEYIVVDGGSTDGTIEIICKNLDIVDVFISEKDGGVYDAINKGIALSKGMLIGILHAGSEYTDVAISHAASLARESNFNTVIAGSAIFHNHNEKNLVIRSQLPAISSKNTSVLHETLFIPRSIYESIGVYDLKYKISADFDWVSRAVTRKVVFAYTDHLYVDYIANWGLSAAIENFHSKILDHFKVMNRDVGLVFALKRYLTRLICQTQKKIFKN